MTFEKDSCSEGMTAALPCLRCGWPMHEAAALEVTAIREEFRHRRSRQIFGLLVFVILLLALASIRAGAQALPGDSIYRLAIPLVDQQGHEFRLADRRGTPVLITMFYTSCKFVCPLVIDTLLATEHAVDGKDRSRLDVVVVSFDPERDTPARLEAVFKQRHLDANHWTFAQTETPNVRKLAAALDIRYRVLADGEINHSSVLVLLDSEGRIVSRTDKLGESDPDFVAAIRRVLGSNEPRP